MCPARADSQRNHQEITTATREIISTVPSTATPGSLSSQFLRRILHGAESVQLQRKEKERRIVGYRSYVVRIICRKGTGIVSGNQC